MSNPRQRDVPVKKTLIVDISLVSNKLVINDSSFHQFINSIKNSPTDVSYCIDKLARNIYRYKGRDFCSKLTTDESIDSCIEQLTAKYRPFRDNYDDDNKIPTIIPGESLGLISQKELAKTIEFVQSNCGVNETALSKEFLQNKFKSILQSLNPDCKRDVLLSVSNKMQNTISDHCRKKDDSPVCLRVKEGVNFVLSKALQTATNGKSQICQIKSDPLDTIQDLIEIASESTCEILPVGKNRVIGSLDMKGPVKGSYQLSRPQSDKFIVDLDIDFSMEEDESSDDIAIFELKQKLNQCLTQINEKLKGPDGKKIELRVNHPNANNTSLRHYVKVTTKSIRQNSGRWSTTTSCPTMTHEMLHLLGLCDEYKEKSMGYTIEPTTGEKKFTENLPPVAPGDNAIHSFNCRSIGPRDSIMSNQWSAFDSAFGSTNQVSCLCDTKEDCDELGKSNSPPTESVCKGIFLENGQELPSSLIQQYSEKGRLHKIEVTSPPRRNSLLFPAQFRHIIQPGCKQSVGTYLECSKNAYKTSIDQRGNKCPDISKTCQDEGDAWLK